jgi:hypothetical protein
MPEFISDLELEQAESCRLIDSDGSQWEVTDISLENGRAWVSARLRDPSDAPEREIPTSGNGLRHTRIFDSSLSPGVRLVWNLPGGRRVTARGRRDGELRWEVEEGDHDRHAPDRFFADPFFQT